MTTDGPTPLLAFTDEALEKILGFREQAPTPERQAMWIEITGMSGGEWTYNLSLRPTDEAGPDDTVESHGELTVVVPEHDVDKLTGAARCPSACSRSSSSRSTRPSLRTAAAPTSSPSRRAPPTCA